MRALTDVERLRRFLQSLGSASRGACRVYLTGGATAISFGWRAMTVDVDIKLEGDIDPLLRAIPRLKDDLQINVELASPDDFIPELPNWRERSLFIAREGRVDFFHYDPYSQALSKIERGHLLDVDDVRQMLARGLVERNLLRSLFDAIEGELYRYPAIDPKTFRRRFEEAIAA